MVGFKIEELETNVCDEIDNPNKWSKTIASAGNRTRASRVAGENSTTEPPMLENLVIITRYSFCQSNRNEFNVQTNDAPNKIFQIVLTTKNKRIIFSWIKIGHVNSNHNYKLILKKIKRYSSPAGNRTPVSRVTGGDTHHYTTEEWFFLPSIGRSIRMEDYL